MENVNLARAPQRGMECVYFISPSASSVKAVIEDCEKKTYAKAHVFFTSSAPRTALTAIKASAACVERLVNLSEVNVEYNVCDSRGFTVGVEDALRGTFAEGAEGSSAQGRALDLIATRLATVMVSLGEIPSMRYMAKGENKTSDAARGIADRVDRILTAMLRSKGAEAAKANPTCDVLILDRSFDVLAPIVHEWTYESMVTDLLDVPNGMYRYKITTKKGEESKEALLGESDPLWLEFRHSHVAEVLNSLADKAKALGSGGVGARDITTGQLKRAVESLPRVLEQQAKLSVHTSIAGEINDVLQKCNLSEVGRVEQAVVFGEATSKDIVALFNDLDTRGVRLPMVEKLRLLLAYVSSHPQKIDESEKQRWMKETGLTMSDMNILENLELLGLKIRKGSTSYFSNSSKSARPKVYERESEWDLFRFLPTVAALVKNLDAGTLDTTEYPNIVPASGAASTPQTMMSPTKSRSVRTRTEASWAQHGSAGSMGGVDSDSNSAAHRRTDSTASNRATKRASRRLIVFIVGGMTRGELREAHALSQALHRDVIIGSTSLETPTSFIEKLTTLSATNRTSGGNRVDNMLRGRDIANLADLSGL